MWFSLFAVVLILSVTFYHGLQGAFSAMINCVLTILSAALAFGLYEDVYFKWLIDYQPEHGRAIAMVSIFVLSLLILRSLIDQLITGNMHLPMYVDRAGGGIFGFVSAMIIVGMLSIGFQMLPFDSTFLGFERISLVNKATNQTVLPYPNNPEPVDWSQVKPERHSVWLSPGSFTVAMISHLSNNALAGQNRLQDVYPDFLGTAHRLRAGIATDSRHVAGTDALRVEGYWDARPDEIFTREFFEQSGKKLIRVVRSKTEPGAGMKRIVVRVTLDSAKATDKTGNYRFTAEQVRLIAHERKGGDIKEFYPVAINDERNDDRARHRFIELFPGEVITRKSDGASDKFDFVFVVPDKPDFEPLYIEFKQNARAELSPSRMLNEKRPSALYAKAKSGGDGGGTPDAGNSTESPGDGSATPSNPGSTTGPRPRKLAKHQGDQNQGRAHGVDVGASEPFFGNLLPFDLTSYSGNDLEKTSDGEIKGGRITALLDNNWNPVPGNDAALKSLEVPADQRLLQLFVDKLQPGSWLGSILGSAVDKISNIGMVDASGKEHTPVGSYAIADVSGQKTFELIYLDETARIAIAHLPPFSRIRSAHLQGDYSYVFLFLVPPGTKPVEFIAGRRHLDLKQYNLVAPQ